MPLRIVGSIVGRTVRGIVPVSGTLGPIARSFINADVANGIPAIQSVRRYRDAIGPIDFSKYMDQFARQFYERDFGLKTLKMGLTDVPTKDIILETQFKTPEKYRYRVLVNLHNEQTGAFEERMWSVYSNQLGSRQEIEIAALSAAAQEFEERYPTLFNDGFSVSGANLRLIEHNVGSSY